MAAVTILSDIDLANTPVFLPGESQGLNAKTSQTADKYVPSIIFDGL